MFKFLSNLINKFRSESTPIPKTDHPIALPLDSEDELNNEFINEEEIDFSIFKDESPELKEQLLKGAISDSVEFDHNGDAQVNIGIDIFRLARIAAELNPEPLSPEDIKAREQEEKEWERERLIEDVAYDIRHFIIGLLGILSTTWLPDLKPKLEYVTKDYDKLCSHPIGIFNAAAKEAFKSMFQGEGKLTGHTTLARQLLREFRKNRALFNLDYYRERAYENCITAFRSDWEKRISEMVRTHAIINRRKYLIGKIDEYEKILEAEGIIKFADFFNDYRQFNLDQIDVLTNNNSKN